VNQYNISVDNLIMKLIKAYIDKDDVKQMLWLRELDSLGIDKYTSFEIAMNMLTDYFAFEMGIKNDRS